MTKQLRLLMDQATSEHRLLDHAFYRAWAAGTLTRDDLRFYAGQYWRQVEAFPRYLETLAARVPDGRTKGILAANLRDERDDDHPQLWLDFAAALGSSNDEVRNGAVEPETRACVEAFTDASADASIGYALGMLYGYESQTPEVAKTKVQGLREHYAMDGAGTTYFELHGELDVQHSSELAEAIATVASTDDEIQEAIAGARAGAASLYGLLDGVTRVRQI